MEQCGTMAAIGAIELRSIAFAATASEDASRVPSTSGLSTPDFKVFTAWTLKPHQRPIFGVSLRQVTDVNG
jgi:hypothetical protein